MRSDDDGVKASPTGEVRCQTAPTVQSGGALVRTPPEPVPGRRRRPKWGRRPEGA